MRSYDEFYRQTGGWSYAVEAEREILCERIVRPLQLQPPGARLLDLGCGVGLHSQLFAELGFEVTGIDKSSVAIDLARSRYQRPVFRHLDAVNLVAEFAPQSFDVVYAKGMSWYHYELDRVNCHGVDVVARTSEVFSLLKPGGRFALQIATDYSGERPADGVHNNTPADFTGLFEPLGEVVLLTDWLGQSVVQWPDPRTRSRLRNILLGIRKRP